jgi:hypothetical protein
MEGMMKTSVEAVDVAGRIVLASVLPAARFHFRTLA